MQALIIISTIIISLLGFIMLFDIAEIFVLIYKGHKLYKKKIKDKETRFKGLIFIWHNPKNLIDYYLDPNDSIIYGFYKGILLPKYKLEHIDI